MAEPTSRYPIEISLPVQWGEMDAFAHVNNVVYGRWFESARLAYFDQIGLMDRMASEKIGPIVARNVIDYRLPLTYPDTVKIAVGVTRLGNSSITIGYRLTSTAQGGKLAAEGETVMVMLDYASGAKVPLWPELRAKIEALEREVAAGPETKGRKAVARLLIHRRPASTGARPGADGSN